MIHFLYHYFLTPKRKHKRLPLNRRFRWQLYKFLKIQLVRYYRNLPKTALCVDKDSNVIVSLTSFPARIEVVYLSIRSILCQTKRPKKIVLWLSNEQFPNGEEGLPKSILELRERGLEIEFCEDIKAHKKYFFAFRKYPEYFIATIDDDIIYPTDLLETLWKTHITFPNAVVANRVRYMDMDNNNFNPYRTWRVNKSPFKAPSKRVFSTGAGGVLYQPRFFQKTFFDVEGIIKTNCRNDDIWLKAGQIANDVPVVFTDYYFKQFIEIPGSQEESLFSTNVFEADNDRQIKEVFDYFKIRESDFY